MLTRVHIDNYKCLSNFDLRLENLTLLAGANGCGKSAVFEVMDKLRDFARDTRVEKLFLADDLTRWTTKREQRFELEFSTDAGVFAYKLVVEHKLDRRRGAEIKNEQLLCDGKPVLSHSDGELQLYRDDGKDFTYPIGRFRSALATETDERLYSRLHRFRDLVCRFQTLSLAPSLIDSGSKVESDVLARDGANFAAWYRGQILNDPQQLRAVADRLAEVLPGFAGLKLSARTGDYRELLATFSSEGDGASRAYRFDQLSDGQRALLVLYSLVFETKPDTGSRGDSTDIPRTPRTLFLDEPDNYVTLPELQPWLAELEDGAGDMLPQVVLISHHPEAIDFLAHNTVWLTREPESHTRIVEPKNDTGLRMSEIYARGWAP